MLDTLHWSPVGCFVLTKIFFTHLTGFDMYLDSVDRWTHPCTRTRRTPHPGPEHRTRHPRTARCLHTGPLLQCEVEHSAFYQTKKEGFFCKGIPSIPTSCVGSVFNCSSVKIPGQVFLLLLLTHFAPQQRYQSNFSGQAMGIIGVPIVSLVSNWSHRQPLIDFLLFSL